MCRAWHAEPAYIVADIPLPPACPTIRHEIRLRGVSGRRLPSPRDRCPSARSLHRLPRFALPRVVRRAKGTAKTFPFT